MTNQLTTLRQTIAEQYLAAWAPIPGAPQASHDHVHAAIKSIIPDTLMTADDLEALEQSGATEWAIADAYLGSTDTERFAAVMGAAPFTWRWWEDVFYHDGGDWDRPSDVTVEVWDPAQERGGTCYGTIEKRVTPEQILQALDTVHGVDDDLDLDSDSADVVLQIAVFGEVVWG